MSDDRRPAASGTRARRAASPKPTRSLYRRFRKEVAAAGFPDGPGDDRRVTDRDLARLPEPVQRYMRFMEVVGRPRDWSFRARFVGRFRPRASSDWMPAEAWQYNSALPIGRLYAMRLRVARVFSMSGTDSYLGGRGVMHGKLMGLFTVADGRGDEFDVSELSTYLNDAILLAPTFLLGENTTWEGVDSDSFDVVLEDSGRHVTARVLIDDRGAPVDFSTTDRFADLPGGLVRAKWSTPAPVWLSGVGRPIPGPMSAVWHLADGPMPYVEGRLVPDSIAYNVTP